MWRDILLILGFAFAVFTFLGLTPKRISAYARATAVEISKRSGYQKAWLLYEVIISITCIFLIVFIFTREDLSFASQLNAVFVCIIVAVVTWISMLEDVWKVSEKGRKITYNIMKYVGIPLCIGMVVTNWLAVESLLSKIAPLLGIGIGYVLGRFGDRLRAYLGKKLKRSRSSKR